MLQKWLDGKKKYSALIITLLTVLLESVNIAPELKGEFASYIPLLATLASGLAYLVIQGRIDQQKATESAASSLISVQQPSLQLLTASPPSTASDSQPASASAENRPIDSAASASLSTAEKSITQDFDAAQFSALVETRAKESYLEANAITRYFAAQDLGNTSRWSSQYHQLAFQDYMVDLALSAFQAKFGFPYSEAEKHLADDEKCPYYSVDNMARQKGVDFWFMLRLVRNTLAKAEELSKKT